MLKISALKRLNIFAKFLAWVNCSSSSLFCQWIWEWDLLASERAKALAFALCQMGFPYEEYDRDIGSHLGFLVVETEMKRVFVTVTALMVAFAAGSAVAAEFEVHMLNKGEQGAMVFEPSSLKIAKGDTVKFVPTDKSHNAETIKDLIPEGATAFKGKMNEEISITFDIEGAYAIKCAPHVGMGMVGLVVVGDAPANIEAIKGAKLPKKAKERLDADITAVGL